MTKESSNWLVEVIDDLILVTSFTYKCFFKYQRGSACNIIYPKSEIFRGSHDKETKDRLFEEAFLIAVDAALEEWGEPTQSPQEVYDSCPDCLSTSSI